jgi:hypothetical protein
VTGGLGRNDQVVVGELWRVTSGMKIACLIGPLRRLWCGLLHRTHRRR